MQDLLEQPLRPTALKPREYDLMTGWYRALGWAFSRNDWAWRGHGSWAVTRAGHGERSYPWRITFPHDTVDSAGGEPTAAQKCVRLRYAHHSVRDVGLDTLEASRTPWHPPPRVRRVRCAPDAEPIPRTRRPGPLPAAGALCVASPGAVEASTAPRTRAAPTKRSSGLRAALMLPRPLLLGAGPATRC